jgi:hypothetical protein
MVVTAHGTDRELNNWSIVLDLVLLKEVHHTAEYLCEKLWEVTEDFGIS